jgi:hypothetical protein
MFKGNAHDISVLLCSGQGGAESSTVLMRNEMPVNRMPSLADTLALIAV